MAGGGDESPRQKMINIMYLVLLAMLALNVSDTVLNAFKIIRESMVAAKGNTDNQIDLRFKAFDEALKNQGQRAVPWKAKADSVKVMCDDLVKYIDGIKNQFVDPNNPEAINEESKDFTDRSNLDMVPRIMLLQGEAKKLKGKINETISAIKSTIDPKDVDNVRIDLSADDFDKKQVGVGKSNKWEDVNFGEGTPMTAGYTVLEKLELDVKNTQLTLMTYFLSKISEVKLTLDTFDAVSIAPSSYILLGQPYTAEVFLTAYDSQKSPHVEVNGRTLPIKDGKGQYTITPTKEGVYKWTGRIVVKQTDGTVKEYKTKEQVFQVAKPSAVVSADKMNVLYIGVDNPISISAPGFSMDDVTVKMTNGSIKGSGTNYVASVNKQGNASISVIAKNTNQNLGSFLFRVKVIPDPVAKFAGVSGGTLGTGIVKSQNKIFAVHENFDFDVSSKVVSFSMFIARPKGAVQVYETKGNSLSQEMLGAMAGIAPGSRLIFDNIIAMKPGNVKAALNPIVINVK